MLIYSYKGMKEVHIRATTLTTLMSVTLSTLDALRRYILESGAFTVVDEDGALQTVFLLWALLLGSHKLFDVSGRGHLFAFKKEDFLKQMINQVLQGIARQGTPNRPTQRLATRRGAGVGVTVQPPREI